jgi:large subunit ribosomal protein L24
MKLRTGDTVSVRSGNNKGKKGKILRIVNKSNKVFVEGLGMYKRAMKQNGVVDIQKGIKVNILSLVCPKCNKNVRVKYSFNESGFKVRICSKCKSII